MSKQDVVLKDVDIPAGYEPTGELRWPSKGEITLRKDKFGMTYFQICNGDSEDFGPRVILRRVEPNHVRLSKWVKTYTRADSVDSREAHAWANSIIAEWEKSR